MGDGGVRRQNRGFYRRAIPVGENSIQGDLNDVPEIQFDFVVSQRVEEAVERFLQLGFQFSDDAGNLVDRLLVEHTARSVDKQMNVFMKFDVRRKLKFDSNGLSPITLIAIFDGVRCEQCDRNTEPLRGLLAILEHLDLN